MEGLRRDRILLAEIEERAAGIVERAGTLLLEHYARPVVVDFKDEHESDPVTAADRAVEQQVRAELHIHFPTHGILGEEGTEQDLGAECVWVLDPLDGTANFAGRLPFFGVSLALLRNGVPVVGCLFLPFGPNLGSAVLRCSYGNGASLGGEPLRLTRHPFRSTGPVALPPSFGWTFALRGDLAKRPGEMRNLGSICFELAMVAGGGFQYAAFVRPKIWDVAAGVLLVREAGGDVLTWRRGAWHRFDRFRAPPAGSDGRVTSLRDWARPILAVGPIDVVDVPAQLRLRPVPARALCWLNARRRAARKWWRERRPGGTPSKGPPSKVRLEPPAAQAT